MTEKKKYNLKYGRFTAPCYQNNVLLGTATVEISHKKDAGDEIELFLNGHTIDSVVPGQNDFYDGAYYDEDDEYIYINHYYLQKPLIQQEEITPDEMISVIKDMLLNRQDRTNVPVQLKHIAGIHETKDSLHIVLDDGNEFHVSISAA